MVWAGFEVGFGISVKNHADPMPQIMIWSIFASIFAKFDLTKIVFSLFVDFLEGFQGPGVSKSNAA